MNTIIRNPKKNEVPALQSIWHAVFGSEGMAAFFERLYSREYTVVARQGGSLCAMGYILPAGELICGTSVLCCAMLYSIAVLPEYRGKGIGLAVIDKLIRQAYDAGFDACVLCPSENSLFDYYSSRSKLHEWFYIDNRGISAASTFISSVYDLTHRRVPITHHIDTVSPATYGELRENILGYCAHIRHSPAALEYQQLLCDNLGGGFFKINNSCAAVELQNNGAVFVKELLISCDDDENEVITSITAEFPSNQYIYRSPALKGQGVRFGMLTLNNKILSVPDCDNYAPWYGLAFD